MGAMFLFFTCILWLQVAKNASLIGEAIVNDVEKM